MDHAMSSGSAIPAFIDQEFYRRSYLEETDEIEVDLLEHYQIEGRSKGYYPSASAFLSEHIQPPHREYLDQIIAAFDWKAYQDRNQDIRRLKPVDVVDHYVYHGLTEWRHFSKDSKLLDRRFALIDATEKPWHLRSPFQVIVHCYHYDSLCQLLPYLRNIARMGGRIQLLNVNSGIMESVLHEFLRSLYTGKTKHDLHNAPNYGEDWSSFHWAYDKGVFSDDGITFKLQTKRSANLGLDGGLAWTDEALQSLCGSYANISRVLAEAAVHPCCAFSSSLVKRYGFGANPALINEFIRKLDIPLPTKTNLFWRVEDGIAVKSGKRGQPLKLGNNADYYDCQPHSSEKPTVLVDQDTRQRLLRMDGHRDSTQPFDGDLHFAALSGLEVIASAWPFAAGSMFAATNQVIREFYAKLGPVNYGELQDGGNRFCGRYVGHALERVFFYYVKSQNWPLFYP